LTVSIKKSEINSEFNKLSGKFKYLSDPNFFLNIKQNLNLKPNESANLRKQLSSTSNFNPSTVGNFGFPTII